MELTTSRLEPLDLPGIFVDAKLALGFCNSFNNHRILVIAVWYVGGWVGTLPNTQS